MSIKEWAKKEIEIVLGLEKESPDYDYISSLYEGALKTFETLINCGYDKDIIFSIVKKLVQELPLTPIEDTPDVWIEEESKEDYKCYRCKRRKSLYKYVFKNGQIKYKDDIRVICIDTRTYCNSGFHESLVKKVINDRYPVIMPYMPVEPIRVYLEGCYSTVGIKCIAKPDNERICINRYFISSSRYSKYGYYEEISEREYVEKMEGKSI